MSTRKLIVSLIALILVSLFSEFSFGAYTVLIGGNPHSFTYRRQITIQASKVQGGPHSNFPVLFDSTTTAGLPSDLQWAGDGPPGKVEQILGWDIVFAMTENQEILDHEIEKYSASTGEYKAWVKIDSLSGTTQFFLYYGCADVTVDSQHKSAVWDSVYAAVWHLHDDFLDSTSNNNDGNEFKTIDTLGKIADCEFFDGANSEIDVGSGTTIDNIFGNGADVGGTISAWIYPTTWGEGSYGRILDKATDLTGNDGWFLCVNNGGTVTEHMFFARDFNIQRGSWYTPQSSISIAQWQHVAVTYDDSSTSNVPIMYINGDSQTLDYDELPIGSAMDDSAVNCFIGNFAGGRTRTFDGAIDEVRISDSIISGDWLKTEFYNHNDPGSFYSVSTEQTLVELSFFKATSFDSAVLLEWATETELDNAGFNIWRREKRDGEYARLNPYFIPAEGDAGLGAEYSYTDYDVTNGVIYYYKLEEIDIYGKSIFHGPVPAVPHDIIPIWPDEGGKLHSGALLFSWASFSSCAFRVEISPNPSFSDSGMLSFPEEGWTSSNSLWLTPREWEMVLKKAQQSKGQLFWRVRARSLDGRVVFSNWKRFVIEKLNLLEE
jgi:hypothetical protein